MPCLRLHLNVDLDPETRAEMALALANVVADTTGKPLAYVMAVVIPDCGIAMSGSTEPAAFVDYSSIGHVDPIKNAKLSSAVADYLRGALEISSNRIYMNFADIDRSDWGFAGKTFA
jgi:phenylpyruvate tautomerase PptA (4-oxalocrotonate tautomerase family)